MEDGSNAGKRCEYVSIFSLRYKFGLEFCYNHYLIHRTTLGLVHDIYFKTSVRNSTSQ